MLYLNIIINNDFIILIFLIAQVASLHIILIRSCKHVQLKKQTLKAKDLPLQNKTMGGPTIDIR